MSTATLISPMPVSGPASTLAEHREALARRAAWRLEDAAPEAIIRWAARTFGPRFAVTSSMADAVLIDLVARYAPGTDVLFVDTGYHFLQTLTMRDAVAARYRGRITVRSLEPHTTVEEQDALVGRDLFASDPDRCCSLRKVLPLDRALRGYEAWASGLRRDDSVTRARTQVVDWDPRNEIVKVNPLARWSRHDVEDYVARHDILVNPLIHQGFSSVGCLPCTRPPVGEDSRSGRLAGSGKSECGIHVVGGA